MIEKVVIDSNALIQMMGAHSKYNLLWKMFMQRKFVLCLSNEILMEYEEMLKAKSSALAANLFMRMIAIAPNVDYREPFYQYGLIQEDPDDNKFVDCALASNALYIVTDDNHFNVLKRIPFPKMDVCTLEEFYQRAAGQSSIDPHII